MEFLPFLILKYIFIALMSLIIFKQKNLRLSIVAIAWYSVVLVG